MKSFTLRMGFPLYFEFEPSKEGMKRLVKLAANREKTLLRLKEEFNTPEVQKILKEL